MPIGRKGVLCLSTSTDDHGGPGISESLCDPSANSFGAASDEDGTSREVDFKRHGRTLQRDPGRLLGGPLPSDDWQVTG